jgi:hypothetical protein
MFTNMELTWLIQMQMIINYFIIFFLKFQIFHIQKVVDHQVHLFMLAIQIYLIDFPYFSLFDSIP